MSNANQRRIITKFRISTHRLEIERGRYLNVPVEHRICKLCKLDTENEIHFLLECPVLETSRHDIIKELENKFKNLKYLDNKSKLTWLMSAEDKYIYDKLYKLSDNLFTLRQEH